MINFEINFPTSYSNCEKDALFEKIIDEKRQEKSGYYDLPYSDLSIRDCAAYIQANQKILRGLKHLVIIGIGGSSLGLKALDTMLYHLPHRNDISIKFLEHTDPLRIQKSLKKICVHSSLFIVISKSGKTIETISLMKYCLWRYDLTSAPLRKRLLVISDEDSVLLQWAKQNDIFNIAIAPNIGGRFSVLSAVGLVPLRLLGYKIEEILHGARIFQDSFIARREEHILEKALFMAHNHNSFPMNILFSYSSSFKDFNLWYVQLWGESLGKINTSGSNMGLTPLGLIGSIDQHSFLQLILEGKRDKTITFLGVNQKHYADLVIPDITMAGIEGTDFVNNKAFAKLLATQQLATMRVLQERGLPIDSIQIDLLTEKNLGALIMYYELLTSAVGCLFEVDTYNQPAVERGKELLRHLFS